MSSGELFALLDRAQNGDDAACEQVLQENAGLIWSIVRRYYGCGVETDDLYQLGCIGFIKAVKGFNLTYGTQFSTYAVPKIAGEIRRFLRDDGAIKVGRSIREKGQALSAARERLMDTLCGWAAFTRTQVVLVFDGYKVPGSLGEKLDYRGIHVVYTKERETGDMYIERFLQQVGKNDHVRVVTSDGLIQLSAVRTGVMRMSSAEFGRQVAEASDQIQAFIARMHQSGGSTIGQRMKRT